MANPTLGFYSKCWSKSSHFERNKSPLHQQLLLLLLSLSFYLLIKRSTVLLVSSTKCCLRHLDSTSARENRDTVFCQVLSLLLSLCICLCFFVCVSLYFCLRTGILSFVRVRLFFFGSLNLSLFLCICLCVFVFVHENRDTVFCQVLSLFLSLFVFVFVSLYSFLRTGTLPFSRSSSNSLSLIFLIFFSNAVAVNWTTSKGLIEAKIFLYSVCICLYRNICPFEIIFF